MFAVASAKSPFNDANKIQGQHLSRRDVSLDRAFKEEERTRKRQVGVV